MKHKKDFDGIDIKFVMKAWSHLYRTPTLLDIINESLRNGIFSNCWKQSVVVVVEKVIGACKPAGL